MKAHYIIKQGEDLSLSLIATEGDVSSITSVSAVLKPAGPNGSVPPADIPSVATFTVSSVDSPEVGWNLVVEDTVTALLKPGFYITDAKLVYSTGAIKTDPVLIEIRGSVT